MNFAVKEDPVLLEKDLLGRGDEAGLGKSGRVHDLSSVFIGRGDDDEAAEMRRTNRSNRLAVDPDSCHSREHKPRRADAAISRNSHVEYTDGTKRTRSPLSLVVIQTWVHRVRKLANNRDRPLVTRQMALLVSIDELFHYKKGNDGAEHSRSGLPRDPSLRERDGGLARGEEGEQGGKRRGDSGVEEEVGGGGGGGEVTGGHDGKLVFSWRCRKVGKVEAQQCGTLEFLLLDGWAEIISSW